MKHIIFLLANFFFLHLSDLHSQTINFEKNKLQPVNVSMSVEKLMSKQVVKVIKDSSITAADRPSFVKIEGVNFKNGVIEVDVLSRLLPNAPPLARGFIGIAFRVNDSESKFECIYIRPVNGRAENQLQRNHSIQYFSYPGYDFDRVRKEAPGEYEAYADMGLNEWIKLKIVVEGAKARLFLNDNKQPSLVVNDLKHGADLSGAIALWVDVGAEGFFSNVKVYQNK
jgi:hypothetical protein